MSRVGAPAGSRVHWLLYSLSTDFIKSYKLDYDPMYHNYRFTRSLGRILYDEFIVIRTSKRCWRVTYYHHERKVFKYRSFADFHQVAIYLHSVFNQDRRIER